MYHTMLIFLCFKILTCNKVTNNYISNKLKKGEIFASEMWQSHSKK